MLIILIFFGSVEFTNTEEVGEGYCEKYLRKIVSKIDNSFYRVSVYEDTIPHMLGSRCLIFRIEEGQERPLEDDYLSKEYDSHHSHLPMLMLYLSASRSGHIYYGIGRFNTYQPQNQIEQL